MSLFIPQVIKFETSNSRKRKRRESTPKESSFGDAIPSRRRTTPSMKAEVFATDNEYPEAPDEYLDWLQDSGISKGTIKLYKYNLSMFLGFVAKRSPSHAPTLDSAWDIDCCSDFQAEIKKMVSPTTGTGYNTVLASVRSFLIIKGRQPDDYRNREISFRLMARGSAKARTKYIRETKKSKSGKSTKFGEFYRQVYRSVEQWNRFYQIVEDLKKDPEKKLSTQDLFWVTSFVVCLLLPGNWKRSGNISLLSRTQSVQALNDAICKFKKDFPEEMIHGKERRLNNEKFVPAILRVDEGSKTGDVENFCVLAARDQRAILYYNEYIRPESDVDLLFVDRNGGPLPNVSKCIQAGAKAGGIENVTTNLLRSCAETVNAEFSSRSDVDQEGNNVAKHLGHSIPMRNLHYLLPSDQNVVATARRLLFLFEEEGERKAESDTVPAKYDPVGWYFWPLACNPVLEIDIFSVS